MKHFLLPFGAILLAVLAVAALSHQAAAAPGSTNCCANCAPPYPASYTVTVRPGYNFLANQLCHGPNNLLNDILPNVPEESQVLQWNKTTQTYEPALLYYAGIGWVDGNFDPATATLDPGAGFAFFNPNPTPFTVTFQGCEPSCPPPCAPTNGFCLVGRIGPGPARWTNLFTCPPVCGSRLSLWNSSGQGFVDYDYVNGAWTPQEPVLAMGASAFATVLVNTNCEPCDPPAILTAQPANQTVVECACATFSVSAGGTAPLTYQWRRNGTDIPAATSSTYTLCPVALADNGDVFSVIIANACGSVTSREAALTVTPDLIPPHLISARYSCCAEQLYVLFDERVDAASAMDSFGYELSGGGTINNATILADGRTVCLETSPLTPGSAYTLTVNGVLDCAGNQTVPGSSITFTAPVFTKGYVLREWWFNVPGNTLAALTSLPTFPVWPDRQCHTNLFELNATQETDHYGARIIGWFCPPVSGEYRFYLASDDRSELYLSSDASCANKVLVATEPQFAARREWTGTAGGTRLFSENISASLPLTANQRYYIEAIMKEGAGSDHLGVAVQFPGGPPPVNGSTPISGQYLGTCVTATNGAITIVKQPADAVVSNCCNKVCFMVAALGDGGCGLGLAYQWQRDGVDIPGATGAMYCLTNVTLADSGAQFRVIVSLGAQTIFSQVATLLVAPDVTPPALVSASVDCPSHKFTLVFSECLDPLQAQDQFNYTINGGAVVIQSVTLLPDGRTVCLFTEPFDAQVEFTITADNITDACLNVAPTLSASVRCPCLFVLDEQLTCATNAPGKLNYSFTLQNNTGVPVTYLYLVPRTNCFTIMPGILTFRPPLLPGQTTNLNVMINAGSNCPTNLCFIISAHDSHFVQCCSILHCVVRTAGPRLISAVPDCASNKITVTFSSPLDPANVLAAPNFIVDDLTHLVSLSVAGASFGPDFKTVCLHTTAPLSAGTQYRLTVNNVRDTCGNPIAPNSQADFSCPDCIEGTPVWRSVIKAGGTNADVATSIRVDAAGNKYVAGHFQGSAAFGNITLTSAGGFDMFVAKYNAVDVLLWVRQAGGANDDAASGVGVDATGHVYVSGNFQSTAMFGNATRTSVGVEDVFIAKYDSLGMFLWVQQAGGVAGEVCNGITVDNVGSAWIVGTFDGTASFGSVSVTAPAGFNDAFFAKCDAQGVFQWVRQAHITGFGRGRGIAVDAAGNAYATGYFVDTATFGTTTLSSPGQINLYLVKFSSTGVPLWAQQSTGTGLVVGNSVAVDPQGNAYATGAFDGTATFRASPAVTSSGNAYNYYVAKYSSAGVAQWAVREGGNGNTESRSIAVDGGGNSFVTGFYDGIGTGSNESTNLFVAKYDTSGTPQWLRFAGGSPYNVGRGIAVDSNGCAHVTGYFTDTAYFGSLPPITAAGSPTSAEIFIAKICPCSSNRPPLLQCPDPVTVCAPTNGATLTLGVQPSDPDGDPLAIQWFVDATHVQSGGLTLTHQYPIGAHTVMVTVSDRNAPTVSCSTTVTVLLLSHLSIQLVNGQVIISWTGSGQLQCASQVIGPWSDVPGATNPYTTSAIGAYKFYQVRCP